ncbi:hypothetical protein COLSTE_01359, partial [Collinsella stercoris DSM 13279]
AVHVARVLAFAWAHPQRGQRVYELNRKQGLMRYDVGVDANGLAPVSLDEIRAWFEGVEFYGRARWWEWVNGTGDPAVAEDCGAVRELMVEVGRDHATAQESAEASRRCAAALKKFEP